MTARTVELSVVIAAYNAATTIGEQLRAVLAQRWDGVWEVIVAENGSTDGTRRVVEQIARGDGRVRLVDAADRRGAAHARNCGVAAAHGELIAFCDADDVVGDAWLAAMGGALRIAPFVTGPLDHERLNPPWLWGIYGHAPARDLQWFAGIFPFGPTANLGVQRKVFTELGGFDTSVEVYEDLDLCLGLWLRDVPLAFVPDAKVYYRYRADLRQLWRQAHAYGAARPAIARRLAEAGRSVPPRWSGLRNWVWLIRKLPTLRSRAGRARWVVVAGGAMGRLGGTVRHRHVAL